MREELFKKTVLTLMDYWHLVLLTTIRSVFSISFGEVIVPTLTVTCFVFIVCISNSVIRVCFLFILAFAIDEKCKSVVCTKVISSTFLLEK